MRISFIGAGRVATHLARTLKREHEIVDVWSRDLTHAVNLAEQVCAQAKHELNQLHSDIDLAIIAVSDQAIADVIVALSGILKNVLIVHTSGSTNLNILTEHHQRSGVFYPLQTFSFERDVEWSNTPIFIEAIEAMDAITLTKIAESLTQQVYQYDSAQRLSLHLAAVFACNFTNYCYDMAKQIVDVKQVDFSLLYPLILETANKATKNDPRHMQTGPAMRGDQNILTMHTQMLADANREDLKQVYGLLSQSIINRHEQS